MIWRKEAGERIVRVLFVCFLDSVHSHGWMDLLAGSTRDEERGITRELFERVRAILERIHARGCLVNGPEAGLVDFPCLYGNEIVFLCWKYGEPRVAHWHRIPDGFAGRRPLLDTSGGEGLDQVH